MDFLISLRGLEHCQPEMECAGNLRFCKAPCSLECLRYSMREWERENRESQFISFLCFFSPNFEYRLYFYQCSLPGFTIISGEHRRTYALLQRVWCHLPLVITLEFASLTDADMRGRNFLVQENRTSGCPNYQCRWLGSIQFITSNCLLMCLLFMYWRHWRYIKICLVHSWIELNWISPRA